MNEQEALADAARAAVEQLAAWAEDPVAFVLEVFGPGYEAQTGKTLVIDAWQEKSLRKLVRHEPHGNCDGSPHRRLAAKACKGPGKTAWLAWIGWWRISKFAIHRGACASITLGNLKSGLWPELALWQGYSPLLMAAFEHKGDTLNSTAKGNAKTCWFQARAFATDADKTKQAEAMAGLHSEAVTVLLDEVGSYPQGVLDAASAIFNTKDQDALLVVAGNATDVDGALHTICTRDASDWYIIEITGDPDDPDRSPRIDVEEARRQIALHGRNDPVVMVNFLGQFPPRGGSKLLGSDDVSRAMKRDCPQRIYLQQPRVWGLDVAGEGLDPDEAVLYRRQGPVVGKPETWRNLPTLKLAERVALLFFDAKKAGKAPKRIFIDKGGSGRGTWELLKSLVSPEIVVGVDFGESALDETAYYNRRTEMWCVMATAVREVLCLPDVPELRRDLTGPNLGTESHTKLGTRRSLETKKSMKARGLPSPDHGDGLCLTYAMPVLPDRPEDELGLAHLPKPPVDPFAVLGGRT